MPVPGTFQVHADFTSRQVHLVALDARGQERERLLFTPEQARVLALRLAEAIIAVEATQPRRT